MQFAIDPASGRMVIIEMNPRVSRSSALASKATGFPIAKVAAKLAVGYTLDEIDNDITGVTPAASSRPSTMSSPRCRASPSRSSPAREALLTTSMKSVGEAMAVGRTFKESLAKGAALHGDRHEPASMRWMSKAGALAATARRCHLGAQPTAARAPAGGGGRPSAPVVELEEIHQAPVISTRGSCEQIAELVAAEPVRSLKEACRNRARRCSPTLKAAGFSDARLAELD